MPDVSGLTAKWDRITTTTNGWTPSYNQTPPHGVFVGYLNSSWNNLSLSSITPASTQYCILQGDATTVSQNITLNKLNYILSFWFVGRNPFNANTFSSTTYLRAYINNTIVYEVNNISTTTWTKATTSAFSVSWNGQTQLKFANATNPDRDSSFLITGIVIRVA